MVCESVTSYSVCHSDVIKTNRPNCWNCIEFALGHMQLTLRPTLILFPTLTSVNFLRQFYWATKGRHLLFTSMTKKWWFLRKHLSIGNFLTLYNIVLEMLFPAKCTNPVLAYHVQWLKKLCHPVV